MAKINGLNSRLLLDGISIGGDTASLDDVSTPTAVFDSTGIDKSAFERIAGLSDGAMSLTTHINDDGVTLAKVNALPSTDVIATALLPNGIGNIASSIVAKQVSYGWNRGSDGALAGPVSLQGANGHPLVWGRQMTTGIQTVTGAADTASIDNAVATDNGYLIVQVSAFTGTNLTVTLEQSSDDGAGDAFAALSPSATVQFTGVGAAFIPITATSIERYVQAAITGTFTTADLVIIYAVGAAA